MCIAADFEIWPLMRPCQIVPIRLAGLARECYISYCTLGLNAFIPLNTSTVYSCPQAECQAGRQAMPVKARVGQPPTYVIAMTQPGILERFCKSKHACGFLWMKGNNTSQKNIMLAHAVCTRLSSPPPDRAWVRGYFQTYELLKYQCLHFGCSEA